MSMTAQEVFDKVINHLRAQGKQAKVPDPLFGSSFICLYRTEDGSKCAFGCLIEDDEYHPVMEGLSAEQLLFAPKNMPYHCSTLIARLEAHNDLVSQLQIIHDDMSIGSWEYEFSLCANKYKLIYTPPT